MGDSKSIKEWYDEKFYTAEATRQPLDFGTLETYPKILAYLQPKSGATLLDVPCGDGRFLRFVSKQTGLSTYGLDISNAVHKGKSFSDSQFLIASGEMIPFLSHSFNYARSWAVLNTFSIPKEDSKKCIV